MKTLAELPVTNGNWVKNLSNPTTGRHLILLPLTKRAVIQYCTKIIVNALKVRASLFKLPFLSMQFLCVFLFRILGKNIHRSKLQ